MTYREALKHSIFEAADLAKLGVALTLLEPGGPRNVYLSDAAVQLLGYPRDELLKRPAFSNIAPEERDRIAAIAGASMGQRLETVVVHQDGTRLPIASVSSAMMLNGLHATVSFFWDLSDQRAAEAARRVEAERLRRLIASAPDGIVLVRGPIMLSVNPAAGRLLGVADPVSLEGRSLEEFLLPEDVPMMRHRMREAMMQGNVGPQEYRVRRSDGSILTAEVTSLPFDYEGLPVLVAFVRDVTERAIVRAQLANSERLAALGTLAAAVAHEINNPLAVATLRVDALERQLQAGNVNGALGMVAELREMHERIAVIVRELKASSRVDDDRIESVDLGVTLRAAERMLPSAFRGTAQVIFEPGELPTVTANASRLEQVFVNLLINAVQAMPEGRATNEVTVRGGVEAARAWVEVSDNGVGIAVENLSRVFDPFFTTKPVGVGTGLGLTVCHNIVSRFGGAITVKWSVPGEGTTIRVSLPLAHREVSAQQPEVAEAAKNRLRVMLVDDQPSLVKTLRLLLENDYEIEAFTESPKAIEALLAGVPVDVIVCDLLMPGATGLELYRQVTEGRPALASCFIFMSGGSSSEEAAAFLNAIKAPRLQKPFKPEEIRAMISRVAAAQEELRRGSRTTS